MLQLIRLLLLILIGITGLSSRTLARTIGPDIPDSLRTIIIGSVSVEGNYRTRTPIIMREMAVKPGDTMARDILEGSLEIDRRKIVNTNLFITVEMLHFPDSEDSTFVNIQVVVKERLYMVVLPVFSLADRNFNEWWYERKRDLKRTTYGLFMNYNNITGRADQLRLSAEFGFVPSYGISYSNPYIDKAKKTGIAIGMSYATNKSLPFRTWNDKLDYFNSEQLNRERFLTFLKLSRRNKFYGFHMLDARWVSTHLSDAFASLNPNYLLESRTSQRYFQLSYSYSYDRRDNVQYPLRGFRYGISATKLGLLPGDDVNQASLFGWYNRYYALGKRWFFNSGLSARTSVPIRQPYAQTIGLGYKSNLVRGYELYVIDGQHFVLWDNELKYRLFNFEKTLSWIPIRQFNTIPVTAYVKTFADLGYVRNYYPELSNTKLGNRLLPGAGLGLDVVTFYNMVIRANYTVNGEGEGRFFFQIGRSL